MQVSLDKNEADLLELFSEAAIQSRILELSKEINKEFSKDEDLVVIAVLSGSILFASDLIKRLHMPIQFEFVRLSSYGNDQKSSGRVKPLDLTLPGLANKNVLLVEDIVDTGITANFMLDYIQMQHKPKNLKFASLLDKTCARQKPVDIHYRGFEVDDKFVVGYGLDYMGYFRNLPYIGYFPN
jgi:hypoxanthine phosphoribosyltransferase